MRREIENWKNLVRFPHRMRGAFCYKRSREKRREREEEPGRKVVTISSQPGCRSSGKNGGKILFQNETRALKSLGNVEMSGTLLCPVFWPIRDRRHGKFESVKQRSFIFVGRLVSRLRNQLGLTQPDFAVKLQLAGWHKASRDTVAKLEGGTLRVDLIQVRYLAATLGIPLPQFLSKIDWNKADLLTNKNDNQ